MGAKVCYLIMILMMKTLKKQKMIHKMKMRLIQMKTLKKLMLINKMMVKFQLGKKNMKKFPNEHRKSRKFLDSRFSSFLVPVFDLCLSVSCILNYRQLYCKGKKYQEIKLTLP